MTQAKLDEALYNALQNYIRYYQEKLDKQYGIILPGAPQITSIIKNHHQNHPDDAMCLVGIKYVYYFEDLNREISSDKERLGNFLERVR